MTFRYLSSAAIVAFSSVAFAGTMGPVCTKGKVTLSCERAGWDIGLQALYLQPLYGDDLRFIGVNIQNNTLDHVANSPNWSWGFKLEGAYRFNNGSDVNLNWSHLDGQKTNFATSLVFFSGGDPSDNSITVKPQWDAVNLELGKAINLSVTSPIRIHAGIQYANIKTSITEIGTVNSGGIEPYSAYPVARFQGIGPRIGADLNYNLVNNWSIYAKGATAALAGQSRFRNTFVRGENDPVRSILNKTMVVPELEGKLGLNYNHQLQHGFLTLDAGYMWVNYFAAQQTFYGNDPDNDFSLQGPYLGLKWIGAAV